MTLLRPPRSPWGRAAVHPPSRPPPCYGGGVIMASSRLLFSLSLAGGGSGWGSRWGRGARTGPRSTPPPPPDLPPCYGGGVIMASSRLLFSLSLAGGGSGWGSRWGRGARTGPRSTPLPTSPLLWGRSDNGVLPSLVLPLPCRGRVGVGVAPGERRANGAGGASVAGWSLRTGGTGNAGYGESGPGGFRGMTSTGVPFGAAGACGARTIRQSARARRDNMLESWTSKGVAIRAPDSSLARVARR